MSDDKPQFSQFLASIWGKVSAFITAVVAIAGFVTLFQQNLVIVGLIAFGLVTVILAIASIGWHTQIIQPTIITKHPQLVEKRKEPLLPYSWLKIARITFGAVILGWISWGIYFGYDYWLEQHLKAELENKIVVIVTKIDGPDPKNYRITEELTTQLKDSLAVYTDTVVISLAETIAEEQGSVYARGIGEKHHADIVIWGYYGKTTTDVRLTLHIENIHPEKVDILDADETLQVQAASTKLDSFTFQQDIGHELTTFIFFLSGYVRYQASDYPAALKRFDQALSRSSWAEDVVTRSEALYYRGTTLSAMQDWDKAIESFNDAIHFAQQDLACLACTYNDRGVAYFRTHNYPYAIADFTQAIKYDSKLVIAYKNRGSLYAETKEYQSAISDFDQAIQLDPKNYSAYFSRGIVYTDIQNYSLAIADFSKAIQLDPDNADAYNRRGTIYSFTRDYDAAISDFDKAIQINPNDATIFYNRGVMYVVTQDQTSAISDFTEAIHLDPNYTAAYVNRGVVYLNIPDYPSAMADFNKAIQLDPSNTLVYLNRGNTYSQLHNYPAALADFARAIQLNPNNATAFYARGFVYADQGQYSLAMADLNEVIRIASPEMACLPCTYKLRGEIYTKQGQSDLALADYQHALTITTSPVLRSEIEQNIRSLQQPTPTP
jgi:tetratricopeptide (TPR) repeat protein